MQLLNSAGTLRQQASTVAAEQSGHAIDGFCDWCHRTAGEYVGQGDDYFAMARVSEEAGRLLYGLREDLDEIDRKANEEIQQLEQTPVHLGERAQRLIEIQGIKIAARAQAMAKGAEIAAAIAKLGTQLGFGTNSQGSGAAGNGTTPQSDDPVDPQLRQMANNGLGGGGRRPGELSTGIQNLPQDTPPAGGKPPERTGSHRPGDLAGSDGNSDPATPDGTQTPGDSSGIGNGGSHDVRTGQHRPGVLGDGPDAAQNAPAFPGTVMPAGGSTSPGLPSTSPASGGLSGLKMPSAPNVPSSLSSGGLPTQGLTSASGAGLSPGAGSMPSGPAATSSDFSRGLNAGLGAGAPAAPFAPPVQPPASTASGSAAPVGGLPSGPAPVSSAAGAPAGSTVPSPPIAASSSSAPSVGGGSGMTSAPVGPLPPFGSDVPRSPVVSPATVSPASGPAAAPAVGGGGSSLGGPVAPLPPGVVGSGVGASAGAAADAVRSSLPDPLLEDASKLVYQLLHDSRLYPYMDWCVGIFRTRSGIETAIVNGDGAGYIPAGVFVPRAAQMIFADPQLPPEFRARWFSWANPAEAMLAYSKFVASRRSDVELWAIAVSTDHGGSSMPARGMVPHFEECARAMSPLADTAPTSQLDDAHVHRLQTLDAGLYARLTGFGDGPLPDQSEAWRTTVAAAQLVLGRASAIRDLAVAPVIREVLDVLGKGLRVPRDSWQALEGAHVEAVMNSSGLRPGLMFNDDAAGAHVRAYHDLTLLTELLLLWHLDSTKYPEIAYLAGQINLTPQLSGVS